jgi:prophage maintenance system killer protein
MQLTFVKPSFFAAKLLRYAAQFMHKKVWEIYESVTFVTIITQTIKLTGNKRIAHTEFVLFLSPPCETSLKV